MSKEIFVRKIAHILIIEENTTHIQQDEYQSHRNSSIYPVHVNTTYIINIPRIVLKHLLYIHENVLAHIASIIRWKIQVQN